MLAGPCEEVSTILGECHGLFQQAPSFLFPWVHVYLHMFPALSEQRKGLCNCLMEKTLTFPVMFFRRTGTSLTIGFPAESPGPA